MKLPLNHMNLNSYRSELFWQSFSIADLLFQAEPHLDLQLDKPLVNLTASLDCGDGLDQWGNLEKRFLKEKYLFLKF